MNILYLAAARALNGSVSLLIVFVLSNYFTPTEYGRFGLILSTYMTISALCFFWLGAYLFRFHDIQKTRISIVQLVLLSTFIMAMIVVGLWVFGFVWTLFDAAIIALGAIALGGFSVVQEFLAGRQRYIFYFLTSCLRFILAASIILVALLYLRDPMVVMLAVIFAMLVPAMIIFGMFGGDAIFGERSHIGRIDRDQMMSIIRYSAPFVAIALANASINVTDRVVIGHVLGLKSVGLYIGTQDLTIQIVGAAAGVLALRTAAPSIRTFDAQGFSADFCRAFLRRMALASVGLLGLILLCLALAPYTYLRLLSPEAQQVAGGFYVILTIGAGLFVYTNLVFHTVLMIQKRTHVMSIASLVVLIGNVVGNVVLVPHYGLSGAAISLLLASTLGLVYSGFMTRHFWGGVFAATIGDKE